MKPWLWPYLVTAVIELPLYLAATGRRWVAALGAALLTQPVVFLLFPRFWPRGHPQSQLACALLFAVAVEAAWLTSFGVKRPFHWSLVANVASLGVWLLVRPHFSLK